MRRSHVPTPGRDGRRRLAARAPPVGRHDLGRRRCGGGTVVAAGAGASRSARSAAAAARIRALKRGGRLDDRDALGQDRQRRRRARAISACASAQVARCSRTAAISSGSGHRARTRRPGRGRRRRSRVGPRVRIGVAGQGRAHREQAEAHPALDRAERRAGPFGDLDLGQAAEVGELDGLALDVGQGGERLAGRSRRRGSRRPRPRRRAGGSCGGGTTSCSGSSVVGRRRRTASIARWWTIDSSQVFTLPRPVDVSGGIAPGAQERVLDDILGEGRVIRDAVGDRVGHRLVAVVQVIQCVAVRPAATRTRTARSASSATVATRSGSGLVVSLIR